MKEDIEVKCCRCRNVHKESERIPVQYKKFSCAQVLTCPRCGAGTYFRQVEGVKSTVRVKKP